MNTAHIARAIESLVDGDRRRRCGAVRVEEAGKLIPGDLAGEAQVVRWCFAAMNSVELPLLTS